MKGVCYCCKVALGRRGAGDLIAAWRHVFPGNVRDIAFTASSGGGRHFTEAARVSEDEWQLAGCPDDGPALTVGLNETTHIVWPTVVGGATPEGALFYAASADGRTFTPRIRVPTLGSPRPMHPQVLSTASGDLVIAWDEVLNGVRQAAVRSLRVVSDGRPSFGPVHRLGRPGVPTSYPLPVSSSRGTLAVYVEGSPGTTAVRVVPL